VALKMLDLFAGLGGASAAMRARGWDVTTVELDPSFRPSIVADVARLPLNCPGRFDLVWASPPCTEYARESMPWCRTGNAPDMTLWRATEAAIRELRPRWWVIENVRGAVRFHGRATRTYGPVFLWGRMPLFDVTVKPWKERLSSTQKAERACIPYALSEALAKACESEAAMFAVATA
jgi:site-specific DNA-cytosine methylase